MDRIVRLLVLLATISAPQATAPPLPPEEVAVIRGAIASAEGTEALRRRVPVVIVPHHLVAASSIATIFAQLHGQRVSRVLLLTPDHFNGCDATLCTTDERLPTVDGTMSIDGDALAIARASPLVRVRPILFHAEHGVRDVLPFVQSTFPDAQVLPLAFAQRRSWETKRPEIAALLDALMDDETLLVASTDASHYLSLNDANDADQVTLTAIFSGDIEGIARLETPSQTDCPACLWAAVERAGALGATLPTLVRHTNSATLLRDESASSTTSHFAIVFSMDDTPAPDMIAVAGDMTVTRGVPQACIPTELASFWDVPLRVATLEGPLRRVCSRTTNPYTFCNTSADFQRIASLATHWSVVSNHSADAGTGGEGETSAQLAALGETPVSTTPVIVGSVRLIAATTVRNGIDGGRDASGAERALDALARAPRPDLLTVVLLHAGEEFRPTLSPADDVLARAFIGAGADAVLIDHSHVPGDVVFERGRPIVRGLGNAFFDQFASTATHTTRVVRLGKDLDGTVRIAVRTERLARAAEKAAGICPEI